MAKKENEPIHDFSILKNKLKEMGIEVAEAQPWTTVGTVEVSIEDVGKRLLLEPDGIYYLDDSGIKRRGFLFKRAFYFEYKGEERRPKFHVCACEAIQDFGRDAYRFANNEPVKIISRSSGEEVEVEGMELCGYCRKILFNQGVNNIKNSKDFVDILKAAGETEESKEQEVDIFGYVKNWEEISLAYRTKKNFTCERCGLQIDSDFDKEYMHTHHKNGKKTDNRESNLECLCIDCHSNVDEFHKSNFSKGGNKVMLREFREKYKSHKND